MAKGNTDNALRIFKKTLKINTKLLNQKKIKKIFTHSQKINLKIFFLCSIQRRKCLIITCFVGTIHHE